MTDTANTLPNLIELNIPGATYTATLTFVQVDKLGQYFATSMSSYGIISKKFAIHLWMRRSLSAPWVLLEAFEDAHGSLSLNGDELFLVVNRGNSRGSFMKKVVQFAGAR